MRQIAGPALFAVLLLPAYAATQTFSVEVHTPPDGARTEAQIRKGLAQPLEKQGAAEKGINEKSGGVLAAAHKLSTGYTYTTSLLYNLTDKSSCVRYEIPDLSTGKTSPACQYFDGSTYFERFVQNLSLYSDNRSNRFFTPFDQFVFLGKTNGKSVDLSGEKGSFSVAVPNQWNWRIDWKSGQKDTVQVDAYIVRDAGAPLLLRHADIRRDHSSGEITRYASNGQVSSTEKFKLVDSATPKFDFAGSFPTGLLVSDYRIDPRNPIRYAWSGHLMDEAAAKALVDQTNGTGGATTLVRFLIGAVGVSWLSGLVLRKKKAGRRNRGAGMIEVQSEPAS